MKELVPSAALKQHIAILGKTGSGKSYAAKGLVEQLLDSKRQVCVLDPTGAWWGLRLGRDGKSKGFDVVILGGERGDLPLSPASGEAVARLVTEQRASVVIDTSNLTVGEYTRWFIAFAGTLYSTIRSPLNLVIDEAHNFAPQGKVPDPDTGRMLHAANRIASGGRSRGIALMMITQRPAKLHKDSLTCADTLIAMRVFAPQDRAAIKDWIDGAADAKRGSEVLASLAGMGRGEGWVWYPEGGHLERGKFPAIRTFDSSATPDGSQCQAPAVTAIDLTQVREALDVAIREAEANDPKALKRRIAELEQQIRQQRPDERSIKLAVDAAIERRDEHWRRVVATQHGRLLSVQQNLREIMAAARAAAETAETNASELHAAEIVGTNQVTFVSRGAKHAGAQPPATNHGLICVAAGTVEAPQGGTGSAAPRPSRGVMGPTAAGNAGGNLPALERALLTALAQHPAGLTKAQAVIYAGYSPNGHVSSAWAKFAASGWTQRTADGVKITADGLAALGDFDPLPRGAALRDMWLLKLDRHEAALLRVMFELYPSDATKGEIVAKAGYSANGHISEAWAKFNRLGWTQRTAAGVRAADMWFD